MTMDFSNSAQLHLMLTHLPVVGAVLAAGTLAIGVLAGTTATRRLGLTLLLFAGLSAIPAYLTGDGAEEIVEDRPGVAESRIERHEDAAGVTLGLVLLGGVVAGSAMLAQRLGGERIGRALLAGALCLAAVEVVALGWVAHLGGEIRHDEIRLAERSVPGTSAGGAEDR
jgi:hypothetical protein